MSDWRNVKPLPCPRCGRDPVLHSDYIYAFDHARGGDGRNSLHVFWFECRRWLGLRVCLRGPTNQIEKDWADLGIVEAAHRWNDMAQQWPPP